LTFRPLGLTIVPMYPHPVVSIPHSKPPAARFRVLGNKDGLVTRVVQAIQGQILGGRLAVGTNLPPEREFAERLGVSRTVVREAVRILVTKGLLDTCHGVGTTVRAVTREEVVRPLTLFLRTCGQEVSL
jgi:DNA-binding FadR family transcriptional regulator